MNPAQSQSKVRGDKVKMMQERQRQWMQQRDTASKKSDLQVSAKLASGKPMSKSENKQSKGGKDDEVLLWTAKNPDAVHEGFVVRKQSARSDRIGSARSTSSKSGSASNRSSSKGSPHNQGTKPDDFPKYNRHESKKEQFTSTPDRKSDVDYKFDMKIANDISSIKINPSENWNNFASRSSYDKRNYSSVDGKSAGFDELVSTSSSVYTRQSHDNFSGSDVNENRLSNKYSMHCCPSCKKLMHQRSNLPFLIIPCGHNICAQCQPGLSCCPTCNSKVASTTENVTLSHVIKECKKHEEREELARKEKEARKYVDEYDSLKTRCEVLSSKAEGVIETMEHITSGLVDRKTKMKNTELRRGDLLAQIERLQEELTSCEMQYQTNKEECMELEMSYSKEKENLDMIENTLERVKQSKDRVKTIVHSLIPTFVFDDN